jgi:two-component system invasion response regulator UvrY
MNTIELADHRGKTVTLPSGFAIEHPLASPLSHARVVLADDLQLSLDLMSLCLQPEFAVVGSATDVRGFMESLEQLAPDIAVFGLSLPPQARARLKQEIRASHPDVRLICLGMEYDEREAAADQAIGARGYLLKSNAVDEFLLGVRTVASGGLYYPTVPSSRSPPQKKPPGGNLRPPSKKAMDVLTLLMVGLTMKEVGRRFGISPSTVAFHKYNAMKRMNLRTNAALVAFAIEQGLFARNALNLMDSSISADLSEGHVELPKESAVSHSGDEPAEVSAMSASDRWQSAQSCAGQPAAGMHRTGPPQGAAP